MQNRPEHDHRPEQGDRSETADRSRPATADAGSVAGIPPQRPPGDLVAGPAARPGGVDGTGPMSVPPLPGTDVRVAGAAPERTGSTGADDPETGDTKADRTEAGGPRPAGTEAAGPVDPAHPAEMADPPEHSGTVQSAPRRAAGGDIDPVIEPARSERLRARWRDVQSGFVDDPDGAVEQARELTSEVLAALSEAVEARGRALAGGSGDGAEQRSDTERLRLALRGYRDIVNRVLDI